MFTLTVFYDAKHRYEQEDTNASQSPMETITLILPLKAATVNNPSNSRSNSRSDSRGNSGATSGVTAAAAEQQWSDSGLVTER